MSLVLDNVSYHYPGSAHGLHDVSLQVRTGELVAVIGPSGSGKSTLLQLVSGLTTGHTGHIAFDGKDMSRTPVHERRMGMVFQSYALFPHLSALDNVAFSLKMRGVDKVARQKKAADLLERVSLGHLAHRKPAELSGETRELTVYFSDLAVFTTLAESRTPDELVKLLGGYFDEPVTPRHE